MIFVKLFQLWGILVASVFIVLNFSAISKAEFVKEFECIPQAIKSPT